MDTIRDKMELVKRSGAFAVAMDIDAAGLPFLQNLNPPAGSKSVEELKEIVKIAEIPFILKGIMTVRGAKKALEPVHRRLWCLTTEEEYWINVRLQPKFFRIL